MFDLNMVFFLCLNQIYELHYLQFHQSICIIVLISYFIYTFNCLLLPLLNSHDVISVGLDISFSSKSISTSLLYVDMCRLIFIIFSTNDT